MLDHNFETQFANTQLIATSENLRLIGRQPLIVYISPVATFEILNQHTIIFKNDNAVLSANRFTLGSQLA